MLTVPITSWFEDPEDGYGPRWFARCLGFAQGMDVNGEGASRQAAIDNVVRDIKIAFMNMQIETSEVVIPL
jgi:hypothetical protein